MSVPVVIACSGLGVIRRGNEAWAEDLAAALASRGVPVRLVGSGPAGGRENYVRVRAPSRQSRPVSWLGPRRAYQLEQRFFARGVIRRFAGMEPGILHVADPQLGWWLRERFRARGPAVFYKDGLQLGPDWLWRFDHVQVLAPQYRDDALARGRAAARWHVIPHFVDARRFRPASGAGRDRGASGGPVLLAVGDMAPGSNKRLEYLVREVARVAAPARPRLWVAGHAGNADAARMEALGRGLLGDRFRLVPNLARADMPDLYASADLFVHAALREPFGICFLEAMASGLPVVAHEFPVTRWIVGDGGITADLSREDGLAAVLGGVLGQPGWIPAASARARRRIEEHFVPERVVPLYLEAYDAIARDPRPDPA